MYSRLHTFLFIFSIKDAFVTFLKYFLNVYYICGQVFDGLDLTHVIQADPLPSTSPRTQHRSLEHNGSERLLNKDVASAKDNQLLVRKEDTSGTSAGRQYTSVCLPFKPPIITTIKVKS